MSAKCLKTWLVNALSYVELRLLIILFLTLIAKNMH